MADYIPFKHLDLTYKLKNYPSHTPLPNDRIDSAIQAAFAKWQAVSPFTFSKITSDSRSDPDIELSFGSTKKHAAGTEGHTIVFNDQRTWLDLADELRAKNITTTVLSVGVGTPLAPFFAAALILVRGIWEGVDALDTNRPDVLSIAVHEIGHALGLAHNAADASVMNEVFNYYKMTNVNGAPISQVDIDALKQANASLFSAYYASHGVTEWFKRGEGFVQVSAGLDNTVWAIDKQGQAREFSPATSVGGSLWQVRSDNNMWQVAVFSTHMVLGVTKDYELKIYKRDPWDDKAWLSVAKDVRYVAIGANGALWAVRGMDRSFRYNGNFQAFYRPQSPVPESDWQSSGRFNRLAVGRGPQGKGQQVWAITPGSSVLYKMNESAGRWDNVNWPAGTGSDCAVGDDGTVVIGTGDGLYRYDGSTWTKLPSPGLMRSISVVSKTNMWAIGPDDAIYSTIV
jgi:Matrixin